MLVSARRDRPSRTLRACEADAIVAYVPEADKNNRLAKQGRFTLKEFIYDAAEDVYRCPAGAELRPMEGYKEDVGGKLHVRYAALQSVCSSCPLRSRCLTDKAARRELQRWEHQDVIDRHRLRMAQPEAEAKDPSADKSALVAAPTETQPELAAALGTEMEQLIAKVRAQEDRFNDYLATFEISREFAPALRSRRAGGERTGRGDSQERTRAPRVRDRGGAGRRPAATRALSAAR